MRVQRDARTALEALRGELMAAHGLLPADVQAELRGESAGDDAYTVWRVFAVAVRLARARVAELRAGGGREEEDGDDE